jgi:HAD superfamily hydrolase (TIGR01549 family)
MKKAIIFDLWGTLFYDKFKAKHPFFEFASMIGQDFTDQSFVKNFERCFMLSADLDLIKPTKKLLGIYKIKKDRKLIKRLVKLFDKLDGRPYPDTFDCLKLLKSGGYKLGLISNTSFDSYNKILIKYRLDDYFVVSLKSYEIGFIKPCREIFEAMLIKIGVKANDALMIGDNLEDDIEGARVVGIEGILIDRKNIYPQFPKRISSLVELKDILRA